MTIGAQEAGHDHAEAFAIMRYLCGSCGLEELLWNSRDGVTPYVIRCRKCGADSTHHDWGRDIYAPKHRPRPGDRIFRDGSPMEAEEIVRRRLAAAGRRPIPQTLIDTMIREALEADPDGEFPPGWPHVVEVAT